MSEYILAVYAFVALGFYYNAFAVKLLTERRAGELGFPLGVILICRQLFIVFPPKIIICAYDYNTTIATKIKYFL